VVIGMFYPLFYSFANFCNTPLLFEFTLSIYLLLSSRFLYLDFTEKSDGVQKEGLFTSGGITQEKEGDEKICQLLQQSL
jgi:hypothetical protein